MSTIVCPAREQRQQQPQQQLLKIYLQLGRWAAGCQAIAKQFVVVVVVAIIAAAVHVHATAMKCIFNRQWLSEKSTQTTKQDIVFTRIQRQSVASGNGCAVADKLAHRILRSRKASQSDAYTKHIHKYTSTTLYTRIRHVARKNAYMPNARMAAATAARCRAANSHRKAWVARRVAEIVAPSQF